MEITLSKVRIKNYRSIESLSLELGFFNILIGQNNAGKTNFLKALNIAVSGTAEVTEDDIFVIHDERLERTKTAVIDIMLQPIDEDRIICNKFSEFWTSVFTERWITTSADGDFVGIRTEIKFDPQKEDYNLSHHRILRWGG